MDEHLHSVELTSPVSYATYASWLEEYKNGHLSTRSKQFSTKNLTSPTQADILRASELNAQDVALGSQLLSEGKVTCLLLAGGTGGRFFGYEIPEDKRIKILAPVLDVPGRPTKTSPLDVRLAYSARRFPNINYDIICGDSNTAFFTQEAHSAALREGFPPQNMRIYPKPGIDRFNPSPEDLKEAKIFAEKLNLSQSDLDSATTKYSSINGEIGAPFVVDTGEVATHGPGHLGALLQYIAEGRLAEDIQKGIDVVMICNGEDLAAMPDPGIIGHLAGSELAGLAIVTDNHKEKGLLIKNQGNLVIAEKDTLPNDLNADEMPYTSTNNFYFKTKALAQLLGFPVEDLPNTSKDRILEAIQQNILAKVKPIVEIKPVPMADGNLRFCGQFALPLGSITSLMPNLGYVWKPHEDAIQQMKKPSDIEGINQRVKVLLEQ